MKTTPIITATLAAALLAGCGAAPDTTKQPVHGATQASASPPATYMPTKTAQSQAASQQDPVQVGKMFLQAAYRWDTQTGTNLTAALKRVEYMAIDKLASQFVAPPNATGSAAWNRAAKHQAHTEPKVTVVPEGHQGLVKSTAGTKKAGYMVSWDWHGPHGYWQDGGKDLVTLTLAKTDNGWKVTSFEPTPLQ
jgi:hypothetical protein